MKKLQIICHKYANVNIIFLFPEETRKVMIDRL